MGPHQSKNQHKDDHDGQGRGVHQVTATKQLFYHLEDEPITQYYSLGRKLGQPGGFGFAQLAVHRETKERRAVKVINKIKFRKSSKSQMNMFYQEMAIMKDLDHPNLIKGYEMFEDEKNLYMVMELCEGGELFDRIKDKSDRGERYSEQDAARILRQICEGIKWMHDHKMAHCDLKPDNFLFKDQKEDSLVKIIDFNLSKYVEPLQYHRNMVGTKYYIAPEVLDGKYTYHCDMWSFGVIMYFLIFGYPPFRGHSDKSTYRKIRKGFEPRVQAGYGPWFPEDIPASAEAKDLIAGLLDSNYSNRLTAAEALEHPWLSGGASTAPLVSKVLSNMTTFTASCKFRTLVLRVMATNFCDPEVEELKNCFQAIDTDNNGYITYDELKVAMNEAKLGEHVDVKQLLDLVDVAGDGQMSYEELVMASIHRRLLAKEERIHNLFCTLDVTNSGTLTPQEITAVLDPQEDIDSEELKVMIAEVDKNHEGSINYSEFLDMFWGRLDPAYPAREDTLEEGEKQSVTPSTRPRAEAEEEARVSKTARTQ